MPSISYPLAFAAGLLSFVSPCVLPLVPVYLGYLSGTSLSGDTPHNRRQVFAHAVFFVGGFTLVFVILFGLPATILGTALQQYSHWIARIGGLILIMFGLHMIGLFTVPFLDMSRQTQLGSGMEMGYARSTLFGVTFGAA